MSNLILKDFLTSVEGFTGAPVEVINRRNQLLLEFAPIAPAVDGIFDYTTEVVSLKAAAACKEKTSAVVDDMVNCIQAMGNSSVGLAAPQIGHSVRILCMCMINKTGRPWQFFVNPTFEPVYQKGTFMMPEGCFSIPGISGSVRRHFQIKVKAFDGVGTPVNCTLKGYEAGIFQHEYDHLDGVLFIDRADEGSLCKAEAADDAIVAE